MTDALVASRSHVLDYVAPLIGTPYLSTILEANTPLDCWEFVRHLYAYVGHPLPQAWKEAIRHFRQVEAPYACMDALVFVNPETLEHHVGCYLGSVPHLTGREWFIHAAKSTNGVARSSLQRTPWAEWVDHALRLKGEPLCV